MAEIIRKDGTSPRNPGEFTAREYNDVAANAHLQAINLLKNDFEICSDLLSRRDAWKLGYSVNEVNCKYDLKKKYVAAIFHYVLTAKVGKKHAVKCVADFGVFYNVGEVENAAAAEAFCHNVGMYAAYPYFRALVANLAWNAGVDLPPLPSIATTNYRPRSVPSEPEANVNGK